MKTLPVLSLLLLVVLVPLTACADKNNSETSQTGVALPTAEVVAAKPADVTATPPGVAMLEFQEGRHYLKLPNRITPLAPASKIEVTELFWYGCPHCYQLEPVANAWKATMPADVFFRQVPAVLNPKWALQARAYYAAEALGLLKDSHEKVFQAIHDQGRNLNSEDALVRFFVSLGADEKAFRDAMNSPAVSAKVSQSERLGQGYGSSGVPSIVVDGQYRVLLDYIGSYEELFGIVDHLVQKVRADRSSSG
jgi:thiol:disulfide interchange protein DsbA